MLCGFMALYNYYGPLAPGLNFVKISLTYFYSLFISPSALHLIAERLASVTADISFKVFGLTRLRARFAHGVGRVVGAWDSGTSFAGSTPRSVIFHDAYNSLI